MVRWSTELKLCGHFLSSGGTLLIREKASLPDIFGTAAFQAQRAIDMACYCNAWSSGRLIVNTCQQMLEQQRAPALFLTTVCASLEHLPTYLMNLISTAHWRLRLLVGSPPSHTNSFCLAYCRCCLMCFTLFTSSWGTVPPQITSWQIQPSGFRRPPSAHSSMHWGCAVTKLLIDYVA